MHDGTCILGKTEDNNMRGVANTLEECVGEQLEKDLSVLVDQAECE